MDHNSIITQKKKKKTNNKMKSTPGSTSESNSKLSSSCLTPSSSSSSRCYLTNLPTELHLSILSHLRATDLSQLQQTCQLFSQKSLIHSTITLFANDIYPSDLTKGFDTPIIGGEVNSVDRPGQSLFWNYEVLRNMEMLVVARILSRPEPRVENMEGGNTHLVDNGNFYVSKSWCRTALRWLEAQNEERREREIRRQEEQQSLLQDQTIPPPSSSTSSKKKKHVHTPKQKKLSKKQERRRRKISNNAKALTPPPTDINQDITCEHGHLTIHSTRGSRARARLMDKQAWRILKKLHPNQSSSFFSTSNTSNSSISNSSFSNSTCTTSPTNLYKYGRDFAVRNGECIHCTLEAETKRKNDLDLKIRAMEERKRCLSNDLVKGFYLRKNGVPNSCLVYSPTASFGGGSVGSGTGGVTNVASISSYSTPTTTAYASQNSSTLPPPPPSSFNTCPLVPGVYNVLPREWCHRWRKYIKSGEGGMPEAPDASALLCDGHKLPLIPPHLEQFLHGETASLFSTTPCTRQEESFSGRGQMRHSTTTAAAATTTSAHAARNEFATLGLSDADIQAQRLAMIELEHRRQQQQQQQQQQQRNVHTLQDLQHRQHETSNTHNTTNTSIEINNAQLDRENNVVVEILTSEELAALQKWWPKIAIHSSYSLTFAITTNEDSGISIGCDGSISSGGSGETEIVYTTPPCRECDASARVHDAANHLLSGGTISSMRKQNRNRYHHRKR